jgi:hypothetical protein
MKLGISHLSILCDVGSSDPYVVLQLDGRTRRTEWCVDKTFCGVVLFH